VVASTETTRAETKEIGYQVVYLIIPSDRHYNRVKYHLQYRQQTQVDHPVALVTETHINLVILKLDVSG